MGREKRKWRKVVKKLHRKKIRQKLATSFSELEKNKTDCINSNDETDEALEIDKEYFLSKEGWLERERHAELVNAMRRAEQEKVAKAKADAERKIREEWVEKEQKEKLEKEEKEKLEKERKEKQARTYHDESYLWSEIGLFKVFGIINQIIFMDEEFNQFLDFLCGDIETPPIRYIMPEGYEESEQEQCHLFNKTAACRFFERCKLAHPSPTLSQIILIPNFFSNFLLEENLRDEYDMDLGLECEENELYKQFLEFYNDVLPEFKKHGQVVQFKVCCNLEPHLRGNVYIQYDNIRSSVEAFRTFNGRFYNGKQISLRFVKIESWKTAICWSFLRRTCVRGRSCNYLHVFRSPTKEFVLADRDFKEIVVQGSSRSFQKTPINSIQESSKSSSTCCNASLKRTLSDSEAKTREKKKDNVECSSSEKNHKRVKESNDLDNSTEKHKDKAKISKITDPEKAQEPIQIETIRKHKKHKSDSSKHKKSKKHKKNKKNSKKSKKEKKG